jgi:hypothetical protein
MALPFMGMSIAFLLLGLITGILRLMAQNEIGPLLLAELYTFHPLLMVFGFIGGMIMTERIAGLGLLPQTKMARHSLAIPLFIFAGMVVEVMGHLFHLTYIRYVGAALLVVSVFFFFLLLRVFFTMGREKVSILFMIVSASALLLSSVLSAFSPPAGNVGFIMILLLFPIVFILGERVELTSLATKSSSSKFIPVLLLAIVAVGLFGFEATFSGTATTSFLFAFVVMGIIFCFFLIAERSARPKVVVSPFQRYVSKHVEFAHAWGIVGSAFGVMYSLAPLLVYYDAFIHSLALGFIGLMFLAHGPIILPMVTQRQFDTTKISYIPLIILTVALITRIGFELLLLYNDALVPRLVVAVSGWLVLFALISFIAVVGRGIKGSYLHGQPSVG